MNSLNFVGRITKDPELYTAAEGNEILTFTLVDNVYKGREKGSVPVYVTFTAYRQKAKYIYQYAKKGDVLSVNGHFDNYKVELIDGRQGTRESHIVDDVQILGKTQTSESEEQQF